MGSKAKRRTRLYVLLVVFSMLALSGIGILVQMYMEKVQAVSEMNAAKQDQEEQKNAVEEQIKEAGTKRTDLINEIQQLESEKSARQFASNVRTVHSDLANMEELTELKAQIEAYLSDKEGTWSVYVEDLTNPSYLQYNDQQMKAASLIKLFIMGAVYSHAEAGDLELTDEIEELLSQMITVSDNESANELVRRLSSTGDNFEEGMAAVNAYIREAGYSSTSQGRDLRDFRDEPAPGENYTSVYDCGLFLKRIYNGENVSEAASEAMLGWLKNQQRTYKIPAGLPEGVESANKTGELSDTENDVAIVYGNGGSDYILCVMSQDLTDVGSAQIEIQELSGMVYDYLESQ